jgi:hypothetical protein
MSESSTAWWVAVVAGGGAAVAIAAPECGGPCVVVLATILFEGEKLFAMRVDTVACHHDFVRGGRSCWLSS